MNKIFERAVVTAWQKARRVFSPEAVLVVDESSIPAAFGSESSAGRAVGGALNQEVANLSVSILTSDLPRTLQERETVGFRSSLAGGLRHGVIGNIQTSEGSPIVALDIQVTPALKTANRVNKLRY